MSEHPHGPGLAHPPYPAGLLLAGRSVVVIGGGHVAARRLDTMLASGADVTIVSPVMHPELLARAGETGDAGRLTLVVRDYDVGDLEGAWYAMAATDQAEVNARVCAEAEERRIFCVRADEALRGTAWTPASGRLGSVVVAVLADRDPGLSARTRDALLAALRSGAGTDDDG